MGEIDWDLITRYAAGQVNPAERQWVDRLLVGDPRVAGFVAAMREVTADGDAAVSAEHRAMQLARVKQAGAAQPARPAPTRVPRFTLPPRWGAWIGLAAAALLAVGATGWWVTRQQEIRAHRTPARPAYSVTTTTFGQRLSLRFSDGTTVTLGPGSTLRTPANYGQPDRTVELQGEGVFTVAHDSIRPFTVHTDRMVATDLGTRFLVRAYAEDPVSEVVVAEGRVAVRQADAALSASAPADSVLLGVGERVHVGQNGRMLHSRGVPLGEYFDWVEGSLVFRDLSLRDVARRLSRWYDIEIRLVPDNIGERTLRATVGRESAVEALQGIAATLDLRLSRAGRVYTLSTN